jgi:hypothetical protein
MTIIEANTATAATAVPTPLPRVVAVGRRTIDTVLSASGAVMTAALVVAGALLMWGSNFSADYVDRELSSQHIRFPDAAALAKGGRADLVEYAGETVNSGPEAQAYASYIDGHLAGIGGGKTYADLGEVETAAKAAVESARTGGSTESEIAALQAEADSITAQRNTVFKGETLRGLLLSAFAWAKVGAIAGYAAIAAFVAGAVMLVLTALGIRHHHKEVAAQR